MKKVFITGITGMDGSYLAEKWLTKSKQFEVHGLIRRNSTSNLGNISAIAHLLHLHEGDLIDKGCLRNLMKELRPEYVFNMAAQSHVGTSFSNPSYTMDVTGLGAMNLMDAFVEYCPDSKFYQASSSEMFGAGAPIPQNENTPLHPVSPYAIAKTLAHLYARMLRREGYFITCGILFNHESERRGINFVTQKIAKAAGQREHIKLGNLSAKRDWGYAPEYVYGILQMMDLDKPDDFILATNESHSVQEFLELAFQYAGLNWADYVTIDPALMRPNEVSWLQGTYSKIHSATGWRPQTNFVQLVYKMVDFWNTDGVAYNFPPRKIDISAQSKKTS